jgi:hypothetical protein
MITPAPTVAMASETTLPPTAGAAPPAPPIDEVLENTIDLSALKTLLESVGVLDDLKSLGPFTVFGKDFVSVCVFAQAFNCVFVLQTVI